MRKIWPKTFSNNKPTQPFSFFKSLGTLMPSFAATSPKVRPDKAYARSNKAFSF